MFAKRAFTRLTHPNHARLFQNDAVLFLKLLLFDGRIVQAYDLISEVVCLTYSKAHRFNHKCLYFLLYILLYTATCFEYVTLYF